MMILSKEKRGFRVERERGSLSTLGISRKHQGINRVHFFGASPYVLLKIARK